MRERHAITGRLIITGCDAAGRPAVLRRADNLVTTGGRTVLARLLTGAARIEPGGVMVALGTGTRAPDAADAALVQEVVRVPANALAPRPDAAEGTPRVLTAITAVLAAEPLASPQALTEAGIVLRTDAGEVLYNRVVFDVISRGARLDLTLTWEVLF